MIENTAPLRDLRVVEVATMVMVPSAGLVLADLGAEVVKVEPFDGDPNRRGQLIPGMPTHDLEYCFLQDNRNKRSVALDLRAEEGRSILYRLVDQADIFLTNLRALALGKLLIDFETLAARNPRLIYAHGTGYGDAGPEADRPGYDAVCYWSRSALELTMFPLAGSLGPIPYGSGDHPSGMSLAAGIFAALYQRERTGKGCRVSTSLLANGLWSNSTVVQARLLGAHFHERRPRENPLNFAAVYYVSRDQRPFKFTIINHTAAWPHLCRAIDREELIEHPRFATQPARALVMGEIVALLDEQFAKRDLEEWRARFADHDVPFSPLSTFDEVVTDPQIRASGVLLEVPDPARGNMESIASPIRFSDYEIKAHRPAPSLGEHTQEVLAELGLEADEILALRERGVVS